MKKTYGTVTGTNSLNVRKTPNGVLCGTLNRGDRVEILETKQVGTLLWGRYEGGWICITGYVTVETVEEKPQNPPVTQETGIITATLLNVRAGAGTGYAVVAQLTQGTKVVILEKKTVGGAVWARIEQGWISMTYVK